MDFLGLIGGGAPCIKKYRVDNDNDLIAGIPVTSDEATAATQGVGPCTTIAAVNVIGLSLDGGASQAAQNSDGSDNAGTVSVIINPDAILRAKLCEGATEDTALTLLTAAADNAAGTTITGCTDNFTVWGYDGANAGVVRYASAAATLVIAMPRDIAQGDHFIEHNMNIGSQQNYPQLTTLLTQVNASANEDSDNANFILVDQELNDISNDGRNNSYVHLVASDHAFNGG